MKRKDNNKMQRGQEGSVVIEALFIMPLAIFMVFLLMFLSMFYYQKAALQGALQTSLIFYKSQLTDNFIWDNEKMKKDASAEGGIGIGNDYDSSTAQNPYVSMRNLSLLIGGGDFESFFHTASSGFISDKNITVDFGAEDLLVCYRLKATAVQKLQVPITMGLGISKPFDSGIQLTVSGEVIANNNDESIQNIDYLYDKSGATTLFKEIGDKIGEFSTKIQNILKSGN